MPEIVERVSSTQRAAEPYYPSSTSGEPIVYPEQREDDMGESSIHFKLINRLVQMLLHFLDKRDDVFLSANINLYYDEGSPDSWFAPDILIAFGVPSHERPSYQIWKENGPPQVIFEVSSQRTWKLDVSEKLEVYGELGVEEYYILDPGLECLPAPMLAFRRRGERLLAETIENDRIFSPQLGLEIVRNDNSFRLYDPRVGEFLLTLDESEEKRRISEEKGRIVEEENERLKAELKALRSER